MVESYTTVRGEYEERKNHGKDTSGNFGWAERLGAKYLVMRLIILGSGKLRGTLLHPPT
jgi:hypothetical protein